MAYFPMLPKAEECTYKLIEETPNVKIYPQTEMLNVDQAHCIKNDDQYFENTELIDEIYKELMETTEDDKVDNNVSASVEILNAKIRCNDKYSLVLFSNVNKLKFDYKIVKSKSRKIKIRIK